MKALATRARHPREPRRRRRDRHRGRAGRRRGVRPADQAARARRGPDDQRALQPAAAVAGCGAGRAGAAGRRRRDRRLHHGRRRHARHRRGVRRARWSRSARPTPPTSSASRLVDVGTSLLVDVLGQDRCRRRQPQVGEPTYADKFSPAEWELDWWTPAVTARALGPRRPRLDDVPGQAAPGARGDASSMRRPMSLRPARSARTERRSGPAAAASGSSGAARGQGADAVARLRQRGEAGAWRDVRIASRSMQRSQGQGAHGQRWCRRRHARGLERRGARRLSWPRPVSTWSRSTSPATAPTRSPPRSSG